MEDLTSRPAPQGPSNRTFGLLFAVVFALVAFWPTLAGATMYRWSIAIAGLFLIAALVAPSLLGPLNRAWTAFGLAIHRVASPIVLGLVFFAVVTPTGLLMRLLGKDPLRLRWERGASSYWIQRQPPGPDPRSMPEQF